MKSDKTIKGLLNSFEIKFFEEIGRLRLILLLSHFAIKTDHSYGIF